MATMYRANAKSGLPGKERVCSLYRKPARQTAFLTYISGLVSRLRMRAMRRERSSGLRVSAMRVRLSNALPGKLQPAGRRWDCPAVQ